MTIEFYFIINHHESMGPGRDQTRDPWICSQTRICRQTRYRLRKASATSLDNKIFERKIVNIFLSISINTCFGCSKEPSH